ncbi:hypothetical protein F5883DRAFT_193783 [Diaporthe sp. PMI_573]|nr:hypothetical protein F5883DRAFT_193783 [Diaporthaceae sp. PMI_573]
MASQEKQEDCERLLADDEVSQAGVQFSRQPSKRKRWRQLVIGSCVLVSMTLNAILLISALKSSSSSEPPSIFAELESHDEQPYVLLTDFASDNLTLQDQLWHDINIDVGVVALSDEWAAEHNLRTAQRFPWDQTKGIYLLHGFHNLHCLKIIYLSLSEFRRGLSQSRSWHHISHCMDALRRQILCDADDTPRATERRIEVVTGVGQHRKCRSWLELETFALQHTACYKRPEDPERDGQPILDRFKHCPPGSGYVISDKYVPTDELSTGLPEESYGRVDS